MGPWPRDIGNEEDSAPTEKVSLETLDAFPGVTADGEKAQLKP